MYPFAHEIIVVEGAVPGAASLATPDGHSKDGTLDILYKFKDQEDPDKKLTIVTKEGFWDEKDQMCQAYAELATGDYLWQVDIDEFYKSEDISRVLNILRDDPNITAISFKQIQFWGSFFSYVNSWGHRAWAEQFHRLFNWGPGYVYSGHRPPTVLTSNGTDTRRIKWLNCHDMAREGVYLYHYSLVFPHQAFEKAEYYRNADWSRRKKARWWAEEVFMKLKRPFRVANIYEYPSWLENFDGAHPEQIEMLKQDIANGDIEIELRKTDDIERLLKSQAYCRKRSILKALAPMGLPLWQWHRFKRLVSLFTRDPAAAINRWRVFISNLMR